MAKTTKASRKSASTKTTPTPVADRFQEEVEQALKHYHEPAWLGQHSPLATPYFLGGLLKSSQPDDRTTLARGATLQHLLRQATQTMSAQQPRWGDFWQRLLHLRYFDTKHWSETQIVNALSSSRAAVHRHQRDAIALLAQELIRQVKPALRLELPARPGRLFGRDELVQDCLAALHNKKSVALSGMGGVGKTATGATLAQSFAPQATFWYTITPGLTDQVQSLLFALAYFLHQQGASTLWSQLVVDDGASKEAVALNLLRHDFETLAQANGRERRLLLCFDEVDLLRPREIEAHTQLLPFLETLRGQAPVLLIGQKAIIEVDHLYHVNGLTPEAMALLLQEASVPLSVVELAQLHHYTEGNPRLLELFLALYRLLGRAGMSVSEALNHFAAEPSLEFLLRRIWRHLNESEMQLLALLSVFRHPVPKAAWTEVGQQTALAQLIIWRLVHLDERGGVALLPALRTALQEKLLLSEEKELLHLMAGVIRTQYGQFTAAAYHYAAGGENDLAVNLLYRHKEQEINQGQAEAALHVLQSISQRQLSNAAQEQLGLLRAMLQKLLGHYDDARATLQATYWRTPLLTAQRWRLEGDIAELRGEFTRSQNAYGQGLALVEKLESEIADFHRDLGYLYINAAEFTQAEYSISRLRHEAAKLEGSMYEMRGDVVRAERAYDEAMAIAQRIHYAYGEASTRNNLGSLYGWQRQLAKAEEYLAVALEFFRNTGRFGKFASATYNLALARRLAGQYAAALPPAEDALHWYVKLDEEYGRTVAKELLAEIHLGMGDLNKAEQYARDVIAEEHTSALPDGLRTLGEVLTQRGQWTEAEKLLRQSLALAQENQTNVLAAYAWRSLGELYGRSGDRTQAQTSFGEASRIFHALGLEKVEPVPVISEK